jgi:hypothetical protein
MRPDSFSAVPRDTSPVFMFCVPGILFCGTEGVESLFHVSRSRTRFRRYRGHRVPFSCFARPDSFSAGPRASGLVFMFCAPGHVFKDTEDIGSHFHVLRVQTHFRRDRGSRVPFSCFELPDSFSAVPSASGPIFMFCATRLVFGGTEGVRSCFHVFRCPGIFSAVPRASGLVFIFCVLGHVFGDTEGVGSHFNVLRARTYFRRNRGRRLLFSCFAFPNSFLVVPRASGPVCVFCAPGHIFDGTEGVGSRFHVLLSRTHFRRYRGRRFSFSCFARPNSYSAVKRVSGPIFMFCPP